MSTQTHIELELTRLEEQFMPSTTKAVPASNKKLWAGRILSSLAVLFLLFDGVVKMMRIDAVVESMAHLGYPVNLAFGLGILQLALVALYLIPRTSVVGAILWTGYLGGAISTHLRVGDPFFTHTVFPIYIAALIWGGLYLRDDRVRSLVRS